MIFFSACSRFSQKVFLENELLGPVRILGPAALCPAGDSRCNPHTGTRRWTQAVRPATSVVSRLRYSFLPWGAGEAVFFGVIFHVLNAAHLLLKLPGPLLVVVGGLYEAHLAVALQIQIVLQAFITRIRHHFLVAGLVPLGQLLSSMGRSVLTSVRVWECFQPGDIFAGLPRSGHCTQA